jgi:hypothetical protein
MDRRKALECGVSKISTKSIPSRALITEELFVDNVQIGIMTKTKGGNMPWRAFFLQNNTRLDLGIFKGDTGRRDAKQSIIERYVNEPSFIPQ